MKLHIKIMVIMSALIIGIITFLFVAFSQQLNNNMEDQMGISALDFAKAVASLEEVKSGLADHVAYSEVNRFIESIRVNTQYQYVIVMDMEGVQYSYPYESGVGKPYKNGGEKRVLSEGVPYVSADRNELISAIRGFSPVFYEGKQVGAVLVGLLTDEVQRETLTNRRHLEYALAIGLFVGVLIAVFLSMNIKKSIFGLEPYEIAMLISERELIFNSIDLCLLSVDKEGKILFFNQPTQNLLHLPDHAKGQSLDNYHKALTNLFLDVLIREQDQYNEQVIFSERQHLVVSCCLMYDPNKEIVGLVSTISPMNKAIELAYELTDYKDMVESLRAQNHEFLNKLHTLGGLIQLGNSEEALDYIDVLSVRSEGLTHILGEHIQNKKVAGLLLSKYNKYVEGKVEFELIHDSQMSSLPYGITEEGICSIIGNLLDNSYEAVKDMEPSQRPKIEVMIQSDEFQFEMYVNNNGPIIEEENLVKIFEKGFSTKDSSVKKRGQGLYIVKQLVEQMDGEVTLENDEGVTWYVAIPKE